MPEIINPFHFFFTEISIFSFLIGACVGSFLNVCIWRIPRKESLLTPASHCPNCNYQLKSYENIPILSWLILGGKCSQCKNKISVRYVLIELLTAILFVALWYHSYTKALPLSLFISYLFIASSLITITLTDLNHFIIPNKVTVTGLVFAFFFGIAFPASHHFSLINGWSSLELYRPLTHLVWKFFFSHYRSIFLSPRIFAFIDIVLGILVAGGVLLFFKILGELIWGKQKVVPIVPTTMRLTKRGWQIKDHEITTWDQLLRTPKEQIFVQGTVIDLVTENERLKKEILHEILSESEKIVIRLGKILVGNRKIPLEEIHEIRIEARYWEMPQEVLGMGDIKLMAMLGAFLGPGAALFILFLSSFTGTIIGSSLGMISMIRGRGFKTKIPFGPYISLATLIYIYSADKVFSFLNNF